jgi:hypothetical protein
MKLTLDSKMAEQTKCCDICGTCFTPDPRIGDRQRVCFKTTCQQERKKRSQAAWLSRNLGYFKGRYPNTKAWLEAHPGYLENYRRKRKAWVRADIQDELTCLKTISASELRDIQDKLRACLNRHLTCRDGFSLSADIQDELRFFIPIVYLVMIYKTKLHL